MNLSAPQNPSRARHLPWLFAALALLPLLWCRTQFADLFWFGDEFDQFDQIWKLGYWPWVSGCFAENFAPVFKLTWSSIAFGSRGSYLALIVTVWVVHAVNVALLGKWMHRQGFGPVALATALAVFGLASTNFETLSWTIQLTTVQCMTFFLAAALWIDAHEREERRWGPSAYVILFLLVTISALCAARGVPTGVSLAATGFLSWGSTRFSWSRARTLAAIGAVCIVPGVVTAGMIMVHANGPHRHLAGTLTPATIYATWYYLLNPFHRLFAIDSWGIRTTALIGIFKIYLLIQGLRFATPAQRRVLWPLLLFDLGTASLLGLGRFHTGLDTAVSSRYQYTSLLCTLPFAGLWLERLLARLPRVFGLRAVAGIVAVTALGWTAVRPWPTIMDQWSGSRGRESRKLLLGNFPPPPGSEVPGISFLPVDRARDIVTRYHLH